jgi:hypothetical protein
MQHCGQIEGVPVYWRDLPFSDRANVEIFEAGLSIEEIVARAPGLPVGFHDCGAVLINGQPVPRELWARVRPKATSERRPVVISLCIRLEGGGGGGGGSNPWLLVAAAVVAIAAIAVSGGALGPVIGAGFAAGEFGAIAGAAAISVGGSLAIAALAPAPQLGGGVAGGFSGLNAGPGGGTAALSGNALRPGGPIPRVLGTRRVFPPLASYPLTDLDDEDEIIEGVFILAGPHKLESIRNAGVALSELEDLSYETREGTPSDNTALTLVTRQSKTDEPRLLLSNFKPSATTGTQLEDQTTPINSVPYKHPFAMRGSPDEIWISLNAAQGIIDSANPGTKMGVPVRIRMREVGTLAWKYLPELHFTHFESKPFQRMVKIKFEAMPSALPLPEDEKSWYLAMTRVPMRVDRTIGNITSTGAPFNGDVYSGGATRSSTTGYVGADFSFYPRPVKSFELWPNQTTGFVNSTNTVTSISFYGKSTPGAPASGTDGTLLHTFAHGSDQTTVYRADSSDTTTPFYYVWAYIVVSAGTMTVRGMRIFDEAGDFSWKADDYFQTDQDAIAYYNAASYASTGVTNVHLGKTIATVWLDPVSYPKGDWEFEIIRGTPYKKNQLNPIYYSDVMDGEPTPSSSRWVVDYFRWGYTNAGKYGLAYSLANIISEIYLTRNARVWNEPVIEAGTGNALIAVKATKRNLESVNVLASGYVNRWNGTNAWDDYDISSNPADHFRDILVGSHNARPLDEGDLDEGNLIDWWHECETQGLTIDAVLEGRTVADGIDLAAAAGVARVRQSELWGVVYERDRIAEAPVQAFTPANYRGFRWERAFPILPDGLRVRFDDIADDYKEKEIIVLRDGVTDTGLYEDIRYDTIVTEADAQWRGAFDLKQMEARPVRYRAEVPLDGTIIATRGDLVEVTTDVLDEFSGWGRIQEVMTASGNVVGIVLSNPIPIVTTGRTGVVIVGADGSRTIKEIVNPGTATAQVLTFSTAFADPGSDAIALDFMVMSGRLGLETRRMIVAESVPQGISSANMVFVDEAPELNLI